MPNYFYTAKALSGKTVDGTLFAKDTRELSQMLKDEGLVLISAEIDGEKKKRNLNFSFSKKVPVNEKIVMTKNLSVMVATGLSLVKSFDVLAAQAKNKQLKKVLNTVKDRISKGENLSQALSNYPDIFNDFFLSMVKVGEEGGTLEEVLKLLSLHIEKEHKLKSKVQGAMIYPCIILVLMLVVGIIVALVVLPRLNEFFTTLNVTVPFYTKIILNLGDFSVKYWWLLITAPIILAVIIAMALKTKTGKWALDTVLLKIPLISKLVKENNCAILIGSLSSLLGSGVSLTKSLEVSSATVGNFYFKKAVNESLEKIKKGEKLSVALATYKNIFPFGVIEMMEVGEETGKTSNVLKALADFYEEEVLSTTDKLSAALEPMLIVILGVVVAFFAFSVIEPMYSALKFIK